ncbi:MAG: DUF342 domain-containing protein [Desulfobulbaceae bacterium]|nr:DUF342 domain-containing protein [Desulfobulbaceae bacterium]
MLKILLKNVEVGMVIAADVFDPAFGGELPLICHGVELTPKFISTLEKRNVEEILIVTPPGYRGALGEILAPEKITEDILFDGKVELACDIPPQSKITAGENVTIKGSLREGCSVTSATQVVDIEGGIKGTKDKHVTISAGTSVTIKSSDQGPIQFADIKSTGEINIEGNMEDCTIAAKGRVQIRGKAIRSNIYSQKRIRMAECGDDITREPCHLLVKPAECKKFMQAILLLDKQIANLQKDMERLQNSIELVKKLGTNIQQLPEDKKAKIVAEVKKFKEVSSEINSGHLNKERLKKEIITSLNVDRIFVTKKVHPQVKISIETSSLILEEPLKSVAFFVKDSKVGHGPINA